MCPIYLIIQPDTLALLCQLESESASEQVRSGHGVTGERLVGVKGNTRVVGLCYQLAICTSAWEMPKSVGTDLVQLCAQGSLGCLGTRASDFDIEALWIGLSAIRLVGQMQSNDLMAEYIVA